MTTRATSAAATTAKIMEATFDLFMEGAEYDEVTLARVAERADVSLQTVLRKFGSKDALLLEVAKKRSRDERALRAAPAGDCRAAARVLADRYEAMSDVIMGLISIERRVPTVAQLLDQARKSHLAWLAETFADALPPKRDRRHARRLAQLFGATEQYVWESYRRHLGLSREQAEQAMGDTLVAILASWQPEGRARRGG